MSYDWNSTNLIDLEVILFNAIRLEILCNPFRKKYSFVLKGLKTSSLLLLELMIFTGWNSNKTLKQCCGTSAYTHAPVQIPLRKLPYKLQAWEVQICPGLQTIGCMETPLCSSLLKDCKIIISRGWGRGRLKSEPHIEKYPLVPSSNEGNFSSDSHLLITQKLWPASPPYGRNTLSVSYLIKWSNPFLRTWICPCCFN